ncbi:Type II toxin-antitoxin system RelE/ParE family toxin [Candidatus Electrothrix laxa]|jgi:mRNA interferase RelE/StbE
MWQIKIHRLVLDEDFKKVSKKDQSLILKTIYKKLSTAPKEYGAPLRHELKGLWKLKISGYRVVYKIENDDIRIFVVKVGIRRDQEVYKQMIKRLKKI